MKIAIPTNDRINISSQFFNTQSFKIFTLKNGSIVNEEIRTYNDKQTIIEKRIGLVSDCDVFIIHKSDFIADKFMTEKENIVERTSDSIITNIIMDFKNEQRRSESNTICCP